jgi:hypothetical protein
VENPGLVSELLSNLETGREIRGRLAPAHYQVPKANFRKNEILAALDAQDLRFGGQV